MDDAIISSSPKVTASINQVSAFVQSLAFGLGFVGLASDRSQFICYRVVHPLPAG